MPFYSLLKLIVFLNKKNKIDALVLRLPVKVGMSLLGKYAHNVPLHFILAVLYKKSKTRVKRSKIAKL